jgi:signal peptidase I
MCIIISINQRSIKRMSEKRDFDMDIDIDGDYSSETLDSFLSDFEYGEYAPSPAEKEVERPVTPRARERQRREAARMGLYDWVQCIVAALLCGILIFIFVGRIIGVDGTSMLQTLKHEDKIIMSNLFYEPAYGDIVVIKTDAYGDTPLVKRIIATEGQTIDIDFSTGDVKVDGVILDEDYINTPTTLREDFEGPVTVPEGCVFVMGDNRNASADSRSDNVGMVDARRIIGKVYMVLIPGKEAGDKRDWSRVGSVY